ncbi:MAG: ATP-binding protein [Lachnospiraceae bacterium]|nr:ATP-binding protein [Lachnospiraceae bacterium]
MTWAGAAVAGAAAVADAYGAVAKEQGISTGCDIQNGVTLHGDRNRIKQLVIILLDNGIKYNRENGSINVSLSAARNDVRIKVSDTGIGIPEQELREVFHRFKRGAKARVKNPEGTGLGLAIAWMIAKGHGGDILVQSKSGEGTCMTVRLPLQA